MVASEPMTFSDTDEITLVAAKGNHLAFSIAHSIQELIY